MFDATESAAGLLGGGSEEHVQKKEKELQARLVIKRGGWAFEVTGIIG